jgi:hypothetical protein
MKYITGISALNIPCQDIQPDWHQVELLKSGNYQIHNVNYTGAVAYFSDWGLFNQKEFFLSHGFKVGDVPVASPVRVVLDILYDSIIVHKKYPLYFQLRDFDFEEVDKDVLIVKLNEFEHKIEDEECLALFLRWVKENNEELTTKSKIITLYP